MIQKKKQRQSNIELLRCILMFMVIILHYNNADMGGGFQTATGQTALLLRALESLSVCAVNAFILISAYFMSTSTKIKYSKPVKLLLMVAAYNVLAYCLQLALGITTFSFGVAISNLIPHNWFVILFCVLYLLSPYINVVFSGLTKKQLENCIITCLLLFSVYPTVIETVSTRLFGTGEWPGMGTVTINSSVGGYTIVNFVLLYLIGGYLRKYPVKCRSYQAFLMFLAFSGCNFIFSFVSGGYTAYSSIFVELQSIALFLAFLQWKLKEYRWINRISKSAFGIYLFHTSTFMIQNFWGYFHIREYCQNSAGMVLLHCLCSCVIMYLICLCTDQVFRAFFDATLKIKNKIEQKKA